MVRPVICVFVTMLCLGSGFTVAGAAPLRGGGRGLVVDDDQMRAQLRQGRLHLTVPYRCRTGCGGRFVVSVRTLRGRVLDTRRIRRVAAAPGGGRLRLSFPLRMSHRRLELAVLQYQYRQGTNRLLGTVALSRFLDGVRLRLLGQRVLSAGSPAALRVLVVRTSDGHPMPRVRCTAVLSGPGMRPQIRRGRTSRAGAFRPVFTVGAGVAGKRLKLSIRARTPLGWRTLSAKLRVSLRAKVLLTLDKPIYQPGQTLHLRTLTLKDPSGGALANAPLRFAIKDGRGNLVFQKTVRTDRFGVAHTRFRLASRINQGRYHVEALVSLPGGGQQRANRTVRVFTYRLPKIRIRTKLDRDYYRPGETVSGEVYVWYVFGKPVVGGKVTLDAFNADRAATRFTHLSGRTNRWGAFRFRFTLSEWTTTQARLLGRAQVKLAIAVREPGGEERSVRAHVAVVKDPVRVTLIPESGALAAGLLQKVHVVTNLPGGAPVGARVTLTLSHPGGKRTRSVIRTDAQGLGHFLVKPRPGSLRVTGAALDANGRTGKVRQTLAVHGKGGVILVRPARSLYRVGERLQLTVLADQRRGHAYVDLIRGGQTLSTHDVALINGRGRLSIPLSKDASGVVLLSAYRYGAHGLVRDVRPVMVQRARDLRIRVTADREVYKPGQKATISFDVSDAQGQPVVAALGVHIVDSAVYALTESRPGLARAFFRLEQTLLRSRVRVPGFSPSQLLRRAKTAARNRQLRAADVLLAAASPGHHYTLRMDDELVHRKRLAKRMARAVRPLIRRIGWQVTYAVRRYYRKRKCYGAAPTVNTLVKRGYLSPHTLRDPWGERMDADLSKDDLSSWVTLNLGSDGPDELRRTEDDVAVTLRFRLRKCKDRRSCFSRSAVSSEAEGALGCLMGHTVGDESGLGGLGLMGAGGRGGGGRVFTFSMRASVHGSRSARRRRVAMMGQSAKSGAVDPSGRAPVRVRSHFPEALAIRPALITDRHGRATMRLRMADSITTWRLSALASTVAGQLGSVERSLRVFTPFFVDATLPVELTRGDRITVPVALHNHRNRADTVRVTLKPAPWYRVVGPRTRTVRVKPRSVSSVRFVIQAARVGLGRLRVVARGAQVADAIVRRVAVRPDGSRVDFGHADVLSRAMAHVVHVPRDVVPGSPTLQVEVAPGALAAAVDGMEAMLREPHGCFEQTSSTTYPNVMILRYLRRRRRGAKTKASPAVVGRARRLVSLGYQRLVTFEHKRGGFSLFGNGRTDKVLTAYGLHEFVDMARVHPVDKGLIQRTRRFLTRHQRSDGSWSPQPSYFFHGPVLRRERVLATAYVTWALHRAGQRGRVLRRAFAYLRKHLGSVKDAYTLAVVASALSAQNRSHKLLRPLVGRLLGLRKSTSNKAWWTLDDGQTITRSRGSAANVETTALVASVLLRSRRRLGVARKAVRYLVGAGSPKGGWSTTQANVLAIRALLDARALGSATDARGRVDVTLDGKPAGTLSLTRANAGVTQTLDLSHLVRPGNRHRVGLRFRGSGGPTARVRGSFHRPYGKARPNRFSLAPRSALNLSVTYNKRKLAPRSAVGVRVRLRNRTGLAAVAPMIELGRPAGFFPVLADLKRLVRQRKIARFEVRARRIIIYLKTLAAKKTLSLRYRLKANHPLRVTAPPSQAYEYYTADLRTQTRAIVLTVQ